FQARGTDVAVILDLMIHDLDLVLELVRAEVADVRATGVPLLSPHVDIANARLEFANGAIANLTASRVSRDRSRKLRMFQSSGYFSLDLAQGTGDFYRLRPGWQTLGATRLEQIVEHVRLEAPEAEPLRLELESFLGGGRRHPRPHGAVFGGRLRRGGGEDPRPLPAPGAGAGGLPGEPL